MKIILPLSIAAVLVTATAHAQMKLPELKKQPTPQAVLDEHFAALNACDWDRLLAQYPEDAQIHLANGMIIKGRTAIGDLFVGFCKDPKDGGLKGMHSRPNTACKSMARLRPSGSRPRPSWWSRTAARTPISRVTVT
jgi:hypothetical protein